MSTTTATFDAIGINEKSAPRKSILQWLIGARQRQCEARARTFIANMPDYRLADIGFTPDQVMDLRRNGRLPSDYLG